LLRSESLVAIILGAGRGVRMGGPKALMKVDGEPWWRRQHSRLRDIGIESVWVFSQEVARAVRADASAPAHIIETSADAPMFESVVAGLEVCRGLAPEGVFILPIDCPAPARGVWELLASAGPVSAPTHDGADGHPLYMNWEWAAANVLDTSLSSEKRRLDLLTRPVRCLIDVDDPSVGVNLNTPQERQIWSRRFGKRP
jgi:nicotine blue oxidoreductase